MYVLGIETSCDETGVAIYDAAHHKLYHKLYSQVALHSKFGGVVPELASRDHVQKLLPLVQEVLGTAKINLQDLGLIAYTAGPGLIGALLVGAAFARALGFALKIPSFPVNHLEAHLLAPFLDEHSGLDFPFLALLVSGGHTQLIAASKFGKYEIIGETVDDAVGEAFDKVAKILSLPYPGGPALAKFAMQGNKERFIFPRPLAKSGLDFSFSGLKTCALHHVQKFGSDQQTRADIACAFQEAATDVLVMKCKRALAEGEYKQLVVAGGVSANQMLREKLFLFGKGAGIQVYFPRFEFCTDNGAMIAYTGWQHFVHSDGADDIYDTRIKVYPRWNL